MYTANEYNVLAANPMDGLQYALNRWSGGLCQIDASCNEVSICPNIPFNNMSPHRLANFSRNVLLLILCPPLILASSCGSYEISVPFVHYIAEDSVTGEKSGHCCS